MFGSHKMLTLTADIAAPAQFPVMPGATPIGIQALEIIGSILEDPSPGLAEIKLHLRKCLADYPCAPERALLAHLMETSNRMNSEGREERP